MTTRPAALLLLATFTALLSQDPLSDALTSAIPGTKALFHAAAKPVLAAVPVTDAEEIRVGRVLARAWATRAKARMDPTGADLARVRRVGARVAERTRRRGLPWTFHLLESPELNAFAHAGGHVYLCRGLLAHLDTDDALAAVLGHEVAHIDLKHCQDAVRPLVVARELNGLVPGVSVDALRLGAGLAQRAARMLYSEPQEHEADAFGLRLAFEAGFDPRAGARLWSSGPFRRLRRPGQGAAHVLLQSHPAAQVRAAAMERVAEGLVKGRN